jgi:TatD DNase family protein
MYAVRYVSGPRYLYGGVKMIFETHAHYDDEKFDEDREAVLGGMQEAGIGRIVNVGSDLASTKRSIELAHQYPFIYAAVGVHPSDVGQLNEETFAWLTEQTAQEKVVAVGEIGLDYYWEKDVKARYDQRYWFRRQIDLAREKQLPIIIHSREAAKDTLDIAKEERIGDIGGVVHCYSYSVEIAREYLNMGMFLGIGGVLTYKNSRVLKEAAAYAPMDSLVLETDSPYLTPVPNRGKRNSSYNLHYVADALAQIKGISREEVIEQTWNNAMRLYRMKE